MPHSSLNIGETKNASLFEQASAYAVQYLELGIRVDCEGIRWPRGNAQRQCAVYAANEVEGKLRGRCYWSNLLLKSEHVRGVVFAVTERVWLAQINLDNLATCLSTRHALLRQHVRSELAVVQEVCLRNK